jgi:hypothetical protein
MHYHAPPFPAMPRDAPTGLRRTARVSPHLRRTRESTRKGLIRRDGRAVEGAGLEFQLYPKGYTWVRIPLSPPPCPVALITELNQVLRVAGRRTVGTACWYKHTPFRSPHLICGESNRVPRRKTATEVAAGQLVLAIQKIWGQRVGTDRAAAAEAAMNRAHELHQAARRGTLEHLLGNTTAADFIGREWIECHPGIKKAADGLQAAREQA